MFIIVKHLIRICAHLLVPYKGFLCWTMIHALKYIFFNFKYINICPRPRRTNMYYKKKCADCCFGGVQYIRLVRKKCTPFGKVYIFLNPVWTINTKYSDNLRTYFTEAYRLSFQTTKFQEKSKQNDFYIIRVITKQIGL